MEAKCFESEGLGRLATTGVRRRRKHLPMGSLRVLISVQPPAARAGGCISVWVLQGFQSVCNHTRVQPVGAPVSFFVPLCLLWHNIDPGGVRSFPVSTFRMKASNTEYFCSDHFSSSGLSFTAADGTFRSSRNPASGFASKSSDTDLVGLCFPLGRRMSSIQWDTR